jgi:hypothetical protein
MSVTGQKHERTISGIFPALVTEQRKEQEWPLFGSFGCAPLPVLAPVTTVGDPNKGHYILENRKMSIPKTLRFEVFKRDSFTCQYCGRSAPDVVLHADHIHPKSQGGEDAILNLITSCADCNLGKSDRLLSDQTVVAKQKATLDGLQERREQIEMMMEWQRGLMNLENEIIEQLANLWAELVRPFSLNQSGIASLRKLTRRFEVSEIAEAMRIATGHYLQIVNNEPTHQSVNRAWDSIGGICVNRRKEIKDPTFKLINYVRALLRRNLNYINERDIEPIIRNALDWGVQEASIRYTARNVKSWTKFVNQMVKLMEEAGATWPESEQ